MSFYQTNLALLATGNACLLLLQYRANSIAENTQQDDDEGEDGDQEAAGETEAAITKEEITKFKLDFFLVYGLAMAADWLQGPHIYAIYKYDKEIPEKLVAALYASGFVAGGISATFVGQLADRYGRRLCCLLYCASYVLTCASMLSNTFVVLLLGRLCGGVSTTLLFSVFEAWMITEYHSRGLERSGLRLASIFSYMTTLSGIVAILSGILGDILVVGLGGRIWPFVASIACSAMAASCILTRWGENYGDVSPTEQGRPPSDTSGPGGIMAVLLNRRVLALGIASCFFEGSMYLMIFFWSATLKSARARAGSQEDLPFGLIFSSFMCAMMAGSSAFSIVTSRHTRESTSFILMLVVLAVSSCFSLAASLESERFLFWTFCVLEVCIGTYYPSMGYLKSELVEDGVRGRVYSILRLPLNLFVVVTHSLDEEGDYHRNRVFLTCAALLMFSFLVVRRSFSV